MESIRFYLTGAGGAADICWDALDETYGACAPDETAVQFHPDGPFVGVPSVDLATVAVMRLPSASDGPVGRIDQKISYCEAVIALEGTEAMARRAGALYLALRIQAARKCMYVSATVGPGFTEAQAEAQFEKNEGRHAAEGLGAYADGWPGAGAA